MSDTTKQKFRGDVFMGYVLERTDVPVFFAGITFEGDKAELTWNSNPEEINVYDELEKVKEVLSSLDSLPHGENISHKILEMRQWVFEGVTGERFYMTEFGCNMAAKTDKPVDMTHVGYVVRRPDTDEYYSHCKKGKVIPNLYQHFWSVTPEGIVKDLDIGLKTLNDVCEHYPEMEMGLWEIRETDKQVAAFGPVATQRKQG